MVTTNAYDRTFLVRYKNSTATAFTVDEGGRQYLVSAKHVFPDISAHDTIEVLRNSVWQRVPVTLTGAKADVIVLAPATQLSPTWPLPICKGGWCLGQDVWFIGYPYGLSTTVKVAGIGTVPMALVKRACISGLDESGGIKTWLLDGFNNPGFSGGPVLFTQRGTHDFGVMAIISAYRIHRETVHAENGPVALEVATNSGIIIALGAYLASELISQNPNGAEIKLNP